MKRERIHFDEKRQRRVGKKGTTGESWKVDKRANENKGCGRKI